MSKSVVMDSRSSSPSPTFASKFLNLTLHLLLTGHLGTSHVPPPEAQVPSTTSHGWSCTNVSECLDWKNERQTQGQGVRQARHDVTTFLLAISTLFFDCKPTSEVFNVS